VPITTITIPHFATGPMPPRAASADGPNMLRTRIADVVAKIRAYVDAGCTTPILRFASWDQKGQLARALAEVMPSLVGSVTGKDA